MTKQEAYKSFRCWHCSYRDSDSGECLCGDPDDENCPRDMGEPEGIEEVQEKGNQRKGGFYRWERMAEDKH